MPGGDRESLVMIAGGGTGGHVFPGLEVARVLRERGVGVVWLGSAGGMEADYVAQAGLAFEKVGVSGLRRRGLLAWILAPWRLSFVLFETLRILWKRKPGVVLGFGGFAAGPGGLIAALLGIPLLIHEQNAVAGLTNKLLAPLSRTVLLGFSGALVRRNAKWVGNPVRAEIAALPPPETRLAGRTGVLNLLVVGGSRGAAVFNETVPSALAELDAVRRPRVRHQTGRGKLEVSRAAADRAGVEIEFLEFIDDVARMYAWADLVLCRAGALSVAEIAASGSAAVFVPYPYSADDHQAANADFLVSRGAAVAVPQSEFTPRALTEIIERFTASRRELLQLAVKARKLAQVRAGDEVAELCVQAMGA